ncbi:MAG: hypothetical protein NW200_07840 [Hyphomonadaceae bacterium]|nr:hypothetical protein [Hyphomonadaceae bacterium]
MAGVNWITDFEWGWGSVRVKKTGARVPFSRSIAAEVAAWFRFYGAARGMAPEPGRPFTVAFLPDRARPWYLIWPVIRAAGGVVVDDPADADILFQFEDATVGEPTAPPPGFRGRLVNFAATDVSKTRVGAAFEAAFGYPLTLDPQRHVGPAVEKSEANGAHDGRIVTCPTAPRTGRVYQRVVDNRCLARPGLVEDIRTPTVAGRPTVVFLKRRRIGERFANANAEVVLARPEDVYSGAEIDGIGRFCAALGLDWGGLDVLRDVGEGRLYIVDANKTDMGPPTALPLSDKLHATRLLAKAFRTFVDRPREGG